MNGNLQQTSTDALKLFLTYVLPPQLTQMSYSKGIIKASDQELKHLLALQKPETELSKKDIEETAQLMNKLFPNHFHALLAMNQENPFEFAAVRKYFPGDNKTIGYNKSIIEISELEMPNHYKSLFLAQEGKIIKINSFVKVSCKDIITSEISIKSLTSELTGMPKEKDIANYARFINDKLVELNIQPAFFTLPKNERNSYRRFTVHLR